MKKYLNFAQVSNPGRKTKRFHIFNEATGDCIGEIYWRNTWRKYVSCTGDNFDITAGCNREIADFLDKLMEERK
jgi:hypothetical protein